MYGATEALVAMQADREPYVTPFYNVYFFEVATGKEVKMLYEMGEGELGTLIVSTPVLPMYDLGDLIECVEARRYFKVHGRSELKAKLRVKTEKFIRKTVGCILKVF